MKFRLHNWLNTDTRKEHFGIQAWDVKGKKWCHCFEGETPLIYENETDALLKLDTLNK